MQKREVIAIWCVEEAHRVHGSLSLFCLSCFYLCACQSCDTVLAQSIGEWHNCVTNHPPWAWGACWAASG